MYTGNLIESLVGATDAVTVDTTPTMPVDNSCATVTRDAAGNVVSIFVAPVAWKY